MPSLIRIALPAACVCLLSLGGCGSANLSSGESHSAVLLNPTPVEITLSQTRAELDNRTWGITFDQDWLMFTQDLNRAMLFDHPSRLTPEPVAY